MGRKSRSKNRPRSLNGKLYSSIFRATGIKILHNFYHKFDKGENVELPDGTVLHSYDEFIKYTVLELLVKHEIETTDFHLYVAESSMEYADYRGLMHHIFITDESVVNFLENQNIKQSDLEYIPEIMSNNFPVFEERGEHYLGAIHLLDRRYSIRFHIAYPDMADGTKNDTPALYYDRGDGQGRSDNGYVNLDKKSIQDWETINSSNKITNLNWRILFNTFLYIDAFPEYIKDGPPPIKSIEYVNKDTQIISAHPDIIDTFHSVSSHIRRGHYRFLKSERYKNKRFQTVYVKPTMVKGTAAHVVTGEV